MTTIAAARAELVTAVNASDAAIDPPACYVYSQGSDLRALGGTGIEWAFRVTCAVGYTNDDASASGYLAALTAAKLTVLQGLTGWRIQGVSPDQMRTIAGGQQLTADIIVSRKIDL